MTIEFKNTKDLDRNPNLNILIYGPPGIGKTTFSATAPKPLIINLEDGLMSIKDRDVAYVSCATIMDVKEAIHKGVEDGFKTIVFDTLTRYSELLMDLLLLADKNKETPDFLHWGQLVSRITKMCWALQKKNINTIYLCHEKEVEEEGRLIKRPLLNGSLVQKIPGIMDVCGYLYAPQSDKGTRLLSVKPTSRWYAKARTTLSNVIADDLEPDFKVLHDRIFGGQNERH